VAEISTVVPLVECDGDLAKGAAMVDRVAALQIWCPVFASQWWPAPIRFTTTASQVMVASADQVRVFVP